MRKIHYIAIGFLMAMSATSTPAQKEYSVDLQRRINAHGDEFTSVALTRDERRLIIGSESGKLLVWGIPERRILKVLDQDTPVHCVVTLNDPDTFIAAGGSHVGPTQRPSVRKWHISTGESKQLHGLDDGTIISLAIDPKGELVTAGTSAGQLGMWNTINGSLISKRKLDGAAVGLAINRKEIYLTTQPLEADESTKPLLRFSIDDPYTPPTTLTPEQSGKRWNELNVSPDGRFLSAQFETDEKGVTLLDLATGNELKTFKGSTSPWSTNNSLLVYDNEGGVDRVSIDDRGQISNSKILDSSEARNSRPPNMSSQAVSANGSMVWGVVELGAIMVEWDVNKRSVDTLLKIDGNIYAFHAREQLGLFATGGDDEFVRVRRLADLSLVKEFRVDLGVPQGVALLEDGRHVVFSTGLKETPTRISIGDLSSGQSRMLFELNEPFVRVEAAVGGFIYDHEDRLVLAEGITGMTIREFEIDGALERFTVSTSGQWLVASNEEGKLFRFEIKTGKRTTVGRENVKNLTQLTITNNGRYVYTTEFEATLRQWDTKTNTMKELASIPGQAATLKLSRDEKEIVMGGNHRDVAVFDIASGEERLYVRVPASDFYVTNVWLAGERLLFSTDTGVMFDCLVNRQNKSR